MTNKKTMIISALTIAAGVTVITLTGLTAGHYISKFVQDDRIEMTRKSIECETLRKTVTFEMFALDGYPAETMELLLNKKVESGLVDKRSAKIVIALIPMQSSWANTSEADRDIAIWSLGSKICMNM